MDWRNKQYFIFNKIKAQFHAKKMDDLELLYSQEKVSNSCSSLNIINQKFDPQATSFLNHDQFQKFFASLGVFLTTQELRGIYDDFDPKKTGFINYVEFFNVMRTSITEKRIQVVKNAYNFVDKKNTRRIALTDLYRLYRADEHPRVRIKQKTTEQVAEEFKRAIEKKSSDGRTIQEPEFMDYYADINATLPSEKEEYFIDLVIRTWAITTHESYVSPERQANLEQIIYEKIRQKTVTKDDEGKTVKRSFQYFDLENKGWISFEQFCETLRKYGCVFSYYEMRALFNKFDLNGNGKLEYNDYARMIADIGSGNTPNINPGYEATLTPPREILKKIRRTLQQNKKFYDLPNYFRSLDRNKNGTLDHQEFQNGLSQLNLNLTKHEYDLLFQYFDHNYDDVISYEEFCSALNILLPQNCREIVMRAFAKMDRTRDGVITTDDIKGSYDPTQNFEYLMGRKTEQQILEEVIARWDVVNRDGRVSVEEFCKYYESILEELNDEEKFIKLVQLEWKLD